MHGGHISRKLYNETLISHTFNSYSQIFSSQFFFSNLLITYMNYSGYGAGKREIRRRC